MGQLLNILTKNRNAYWFGFFIVTATYAILYGWFLWVTDALPYVLDNNESFSALGHAYNLYHGDWSKSFGLTDETFNALPEAHPMIHTHQGDWPRIFAFLIYALGARTIESQIVVTTFTIGLSAIWFMYYYFFRISTIFFAVLACVIMMSDYIMFSQWQVNTYRVWHVFFVFSSLLCVHKLKSLHPKRWVALTALNYACLFYGELVFATFVSMWAGFYTIALYPRQFKKILLGGLSQFCGAAVALAILVSQLTAFMGWDNFVKDLSLTFVARNATIDASAFSKILSEFYNNMNIVFFYNIENGSSYKNIPVFIKSFFQYGLQVYSSLFVIAVLILCFVWAFSLSSSLLQKKWLTPKQYYQGFGLLSLLSFLILLIISLNHKMGLVNIFLVVLMMIVGGLLLLGFSPFINHKMAKKILAMPLFIFFVLFGKYYFFDTGLPSLNFVLSALPISYGLSWFIVASSKLQLPNTTNDTIDSSRILLTTLFILGVSVFIHMQDFLYDAGLKALWFNALSSLYPLYVGCFIVTTLICIVSILILSRQERSLFSDGPKERLTFVAYYLLSGFLAYTVIYLLSAGYIFSGYLTRYTPFHVFIISICVSIALYTLVMLTKLLIKMAYIYWPIEGRNISQRLKSSFIFFPNKLFSAAVCTGVLGFVFFHWFFIQYQYFNFLPPTVFQFVKLLKSEEFQGKSLVSNTYSLPFAIQTNKWAFHDTGIASGKLKLGPNGYTFPDNPLYLWFADRKTNLAYSRPDLFVCYVNQNMHVALQRYLHPDKSLRGCTNYPLVRQALSLEKNRLDHTLIKHDEVDDMWAIVNISWDFPPYLSENKKNHESIKLDFYHEKGSKIIGVQYIYKQQNGVKEGRSLVELRPVIRGKYSCSLGPPLIRTNAHGGKAQLRFQEKTDVFKYVVAVTPNSISRTGDKWISYIIDVSSGGIKVGSECQRWRENNEDMALIDTLTRTRIKSPPN